MPFIIYYIVFFRPGAREAYKFPESPATSISGAFPTLHDALNNSFNSGASATSITYDQQLHSISYVQLASGGLLCVSVSADIVPLSLIRPVVDQLRITVAAEFGSLEELDDAIERRRPHVDAFFSRYFHSLRSEPADSRALSLPQLTLMPDSAKVKLDTVLYRFEACELEDGAYVRTHHLLGSVVFMNDSTVCSHLQRSHLELMFLLLRQECIFSTGEIARTIVWRPIHLPKADVDVSITGSNAGGDDRSQGNIGTNPASNFLLVVSRGLYVLAAFLEVNRFCVNDGNPAPDPFLIDWADENLTIIKNVLVNVSPFVLKDFIVLDEARGFYVADRQNYDNALWRSLRRRHLSSYVMVKANDGSYIVCQTIDGVVVVNRQSVPLYTIENAIKAIRTLEF